MNSINFNYHSVENSTTTHNKSNNSNNNRLNSILVSRKEYLEHGHYYCNEKMNKW
jgi:hypothetical protein